MSLVPQRYLHKFRRGQSGVAAIEFVLVFPILVLLLVYTVNFTQYISQWRRLGITAHLIQDIVSRHDTTTPITTAQIFDAYQAGLLSVKPRDGGTMGVDIYTYSPNDETNPRWRRSFTNGAVTPSGIQCTAPDRTAIDAVLGTTDMIVAVVCMPFTPIVNAYGVNQLIGFLPKPRQQFSGRARGNTALDCDGC